MSNKNIIVVDLDSTLHHFMAIFVKVAKEQFDIIVDPYPEEWDAVSEGFTDLNQLLDCFAACFTREMIFYSKPYPDSVKVLQDIQDRGYEIHYYTDRVKTSEQATKDWLTYHKFPSPHNLNVCSDKTKDLMKISDRIKTVVDDRPKTLFWSLKVLDLPNVFSIKHPYNRSLVDIPGIHLRDTWLELEKVLLEKLPRIT